MYKPLLPFLDILEPRLAKPLPEPVPGIFSAFAAQAKEDPSSASAIKVTVHSCSDLVLSTHADAAKTYVQYEFPGHAAAVETLAQSGCNPAFEESRTFEFAPHPQSNAAFADALRTAVLRLVVLDAAADSSGETVGIANLALSCAPCSGCPKRLQAVHVCTIWVVAASQWHIVEITQGFSVGRLRRTFHTRALPQATAGGNTPRPRDVQGDTPREADPGWPLARDHRVGTGVAASAGAAACCTPQPAATKPAAAWPGGRNAGASRDAH